MTNFRVLFGVGTGDREAQRPHPCQVFNGWEVWFQFLPHLGDSLGLGVVGHLEP